MKYGMSRRVKTNVRNGSRAVGSAPAHRPFWGMLTGLLGRNGHNGRSSEFGEHRRLWLPAAGSETNTALPYTLYTGAMPSLELALDASDELTYPDGADRAAADQRPDSSHS